MTAQAEKLFSIVDSLPGEFQDNLVFFWSEDLENEAGIDEKLTDTADKLSILAQDAIKEFRHGKTINKGFDEF